MSTEELIRVELYRFELDNQFTLYSFWNWFFHESLQLGNRIYTIEKVFYFKLVWPENIKIWKLILYCKDKYLALIFYEKSLP